MRSYLDPSKAIVGQGGIWKRRVQSLRWIIPNSTYGNFNNSNEILNCYGPVQFFGVICERIELRFRFWSQAEPDHRLGLDQRDGGYLALAGGAALAPSE